MQDLEENKFDASVESIAVATTDADNSMRAHVKASGIILIVLNLFLAVTSFLFWLTWNIFVDFFRALFKFEGSFAVHVFMNSAFISFFILAIIGIIAGINFLRKRNWARLLVIILSFIHMSFAIFYGVAAFPAGLIYVAVSIITSAYFVFVAFNNDTKELFKENK